MTTNAAGFLDVLSAGRGHLRVEFDKADPEDVERARKMIADMLSRGYSIFVERAGKLARVKRFDRRRNLYYVGDRDAPDQPIPMKKARATAIAPTAGG